MTVRSARLQREADEVAWRWTSTPNSAERGEISVLAIVETLAAVSISVGIALYYGTVTHIAVGACLAPVLLLRNRRATLLGLHVLAHSIVREERRLKSRHDAISANSRLSGFSWIAFLTPIVVLAPALFFYLIGVFQLTKYLLLMLALRAAAPVWAMAKRPLYTATKIPSIWQQVILCTDMCCPPEMMPDLESDACVRRVHHVEDLSRFRFQRVLHFTLTEFPRALGKKALIPVFFALVRYMMLWASSIVYRLSLKSTAIIWSPLIWVVAEAKTVGPVRYRLHAICTRATYKTMRIYSVLILGLFVWKIAILFGWATLSNVVASASGHLLIMPYLAPTELPVWQMGAAVNSLLGLGLYFLADVHLKAIEIGNPNQSSEATIKAQIAAITVIRNTLALYTIACTLYITWEVAAGIEWPVVDFVLFPWSY